MIDVLCCVELWAAYCCPQLIVISLGERKRDGEGGALP